jgi:hypothetical protein
VERVLDEEFSGGGVETRVEVDGGVAGAVVGD